jgi:cytochrome c oxidase subunit IV
MQSESDSTHHGPEPAHHASSLVMYFGVFLALMVLTAITVWVSRIDLGAMNVPVAMAVAIVKATLVVLFFMHVLHSSRLTWVVVLSSALMIGVLFVLMFADYLTRNLQMY